MILIIMVTTTTTTTTTTTNNNNHNNVQINNEQHTKNPVAVPSVNYPNFVIH